MAKQNQSGFSSFVKFMRSVLVTASILLNVGLFYIIYNCVEHNSNLAIAPDNQSNVNWDAYIRAIAWEESRWDNYAVGDKDDVGYLQITPVLVRDANRIVGYEKYRLDDRYSRSKSVEMFNVIQNHYNPEHDLNLGLKIWNSKAPLAYHTKVIQKYKEFAFAKEL